MTSAKAYQNTNTTPFDANEDILSANLAMASTSALSSSFEYDLNGRIKGQLSAGAASVDSAKYNYLTNSYKLDNVVGKLSATSMRSMSTAGTFVYDNNGALLQDKSKKMKAEYGWDGLPVAYTVDSAVALGVTKCCTYDADLMPIHYKKRNPSISLYNFYDADGNRVSRLEVERAPSVPLRSTNYVYMGPGMVKEWREEYGLFG